MRNILLISMLLAGGLNGMAASRITATQLEKFLLTAHGKSDGEVANELYRLELIERLSSARLTHLLSGLPGNRSREALLVLADTSAFLDPPNPKSRPWQYLILQVRTK